MTFLFFIDIDPELAWSFTLAAANGNVSEVIRLLDAGVPIDIVDRDSRTALTRAAMWNKTDIIHKLLQRGAGDNKRDGGGWTALHWRASLNKTDAIRTLLEHGASITVTNYIGEKPIDMAHQFNNQEAVLLLQN